MNGLKQNKKVDRRLKENWFITATQSSAYSKAVPFCYLLSAGEDAISKKLIPTAHLSAVEAGAELHEELKKI